tara:strand:- start:2544 stop:3644 length:1101 start_codon:yes stop_codon:yes gene_type:complete
VNIATTKAVINSAHSLTSYCNKYECSIINFFGEFSSMNFQIEKKRINLINLYNKNLLNFLPKYGKVLSRLSFFIIFILSFFPLKNLIQKKNPEYLIIHLITSLPLTLLILFSFKTKFILRISGFPRLNILRKLFWKLALKKIHLITCPTVNTMNYLKDLNIVESSKIKLLYDPVISVNDINKKKKITYKKYSNYYFSAGRLTRQKNFIFLCKAFKRIIASDKSIKLIIAGEGEDKKKIDNYLSKNNLQDNIILLGHIENIYPIFKNSKGFVLSSLWEDPGFVLIEAGFCRAPVLCSNAWPGPIEIIQNGKNGIVFKNNNEDDFVQKFKIFNSKEILDKIKLNNLLNCKKFTLYNHFKQFDKILINN